MSKFSGPVPARRQQKEFAMANPHTLLGAHPPQFEILPSTNGQYYWRFKAANGEILCHSETYVSKQGAENGIRSLIQGIKANY